MKKVLLVATVAKLHIMEFHLPILRMFREAGWETAVASRKDFEGPFEKEIPCCDCFYEIPFERSPFHPENLRAFRELRKVIRSGDFDLIHCHTPVGGALTRLAASGARRNGTRVIYTAHGFHFYRGAPLRNWLLYYPVERWLARRTDVLITINREDYERARKFGAGRVCLVPGVGVDTARFREAPCDRERRLQTLGIDRDAFVLVSVGELNAGKNHRSVLDALSVLQRRGQLGNLHYLICGSGPLNRALLDRAGQLGLAGRIHLAGYQTDISAILKCCDLFISLSEREGLPVSVQEAMASGLPVLCSDIRGHRDLIRSGLNGERIRGLPEETAEAILRLKEDGSLRARYAAEAAETVRACDIEIVKRQMREIYREALSDEPENQN